MDRKPVDAVELFHAFTVEEIREREAEAALVIQGYSRGENSSSGTPS